MDRELFKKQLFEKKIFNDLKDAPMTGAKYILNTYGEDVDYSKVYRKIVKYQIKKYGHSLTVPSQTWMNITKEDAQKISKKRSREKSYQRNYERKRVNEKII